MVYNYIPVALASLVGLALSMILPVFPLIILFFLVVALLLSFRGLFAQFAPVLWQRAYVRQTLYVSLAMLMLLLVATFSTKFSYYPVEVFVSRNWTRMSEPTVASEYKRLNSLLGMQFFMGHFFEYVLSPSVLVGSIGYSIGRNKKTC